MFFSIHIFSVWSRGACYHSFCPSEWTEAGLCLRCVSVQIVLHTVQIFAILKSHLSSRPRVSAFFCFPVCKRKWRWGSNSSHDADQKSGSGVCTLWFLSSTERSTSGFSKPESFTRTCTWYFKILNTARIPALPLGCSTRWAESWFSVFSSHYFSRFCFSFTLYSLLTYCFTWRKPNIFLLLLPR